MRQDEALRALNKWEISNPEECTRQRDEGQFFGFTEAKEALVKILKEKL